MTVAPEPQSGRIVSVEDAPARLKELDLTVPILGRSIEVGDTKRRLVSQPIYPSTYPGVVMWAETLAELRRQSLRRRTGWDIGATANYATVYSPDLGIAIAVVAGDGGVGRDRYDPRLTRKKGKKTKERVERNARQILIQGELELDLPPSAITPKELAPDEACQTWFLIIHPTKSEVRIELSCPLLINDDGIVCGWQQRILLPPVQIAGAIAPIEPEDGDDGGGDGPLVSR